MPSKTYESLVQSNPSLYQCQYGRSGRVAIQMRGSAAQIELFHTLVENYDGPHTLHRLSPDLAYFSITPTRLKAAIRLFLYVNILHSREAGSYETWDEDTGVYTLTQDEQTAERLAAADAETFMASIPTKSFLPSETGSRPEGRRLNTRFFHPLSA